jgi:uncharacterized protein
MHSRLAALGMLVFGFGGLLEAEGERLSLDATLHTSDKPYVQATGNATILAKPDQVLIEIGVVTQEATAVTAAAQNAKENDRLVTELQRLLGGKNQLATTSYSVRPNYRYPKPGAALALVGYIATNVVTITLDDLGQVGKIIDAATQSGANSIHGLQYRLKNARSVRDQALRDAAARAKSSADSIASGLGLRVIRILSAEEGASDELSFGMKKSPPPPPPGTTPTTPIEPDTIEVSGTVTVRAEIGQ